MRPWNCLEDVGDAVVLDASVIINVIATGKPNQILRATPNRILVTDDAAAEVDCGESRNLQSHDTITKLADRQSLEIVSLGNDARLCFDSLVAGAAKQTLGDGEAATIASAIENRGIALIDERKALRICRERFPRLRTATSMDLLMHEQVWKALGRRELADAVFNALVFGRMRVSSEYHESVVDLIGQDRASACHSLPRSVRCPRGNPNR